MSTNSTRLFRIRARGPLACFTRPELKAERVSYEVMTPSAARGLLEAVFWKPAIVWRVHEIAVLAPVRWASFRRNEVSRKASPRASEIIADDPSVRAQRNTLALKDVDFVITASMGLTDRAGPEETRAKFEAMFARRLEKGQHFHQPYLGCREFAAIVEPAPTSFEPIDLGVDRPLGFMLFDLAYDSSPPRALFFSARLESGVVHVPSLDSVMADNDIGGHNRSGLNA